MSVTTAAGSLTRDFVLKELTTAKGRNLTGLRLRYRVFGDVEAAAENGWILVFHALTGSSEVDAWWGPLLGPGKALDTTRHAVVAANLLGSCYGSTGPTEWRTERGESFPELTSADLARAHIPLLEHLGVGRLALVTGGSLGGMVALHWGRLASVPTDRPAPEGAGNLDDVVKAAFSQRRKSLRNSLASVAGSADAAAAALTAAGVAPQARAEELGLAEFVSVGRALEERR